MNIAIYARASDADNLEKQFQDCRLYAKNNNMTVIKEYAVRGSFSGNDATNVKQQLLKDIGELNINGVLMCDIGRFTRDFEEYRTTVKAFAQYNCKFISKLVVNERCSDFAVELIKNNFSKRIKAGLAAKRK